MKKRNNKFNALRKICETKYNQNLKNYCSIKIGGNVRAVCFPNSVKKVKKLFKVLKQLNIKFYIIGFGTNLVFDDCYFDGVIVSITKFNKIFSNKKYVIANAGANLFKLNYFCKTNNYDGLQWSFGIPGSCGGAVVMNAGCYGKEMKDVVRKVLVLSKNKIKVLTNKQCGFEYRNSIFRKQQMLVLKVYYMLSQAQQNIIEKEQKEIYSKRLASQPYGTKNCGSVFKKLNNESAGKVIDKLCLKGVKIGDIEISNIHANFFVNGGNGTCEDVRKLLSLVKYTVFKKTGINLKEEVIFVIDKRE